MKPTKKRRNSSTPKNKPRLAEYIDHTLLKAEATKSELKKLCQEAKKHHFKAVCVNACNIQYVAKLLEGTDVLPAAVVGFPLGASTSKAKAYEAKHAVELGAKEIDMVINLGALKSKDYRTVVEDIERVIKASKEAHVKVILETALLSAEEKIIASALAKGAGAHFVKTSTGFSKGGATVQDVALMRRVVGEDIGVKASGGIRTAADAKKMIKAGANRLGCSASVEIVS